MCIRDRNQVAVFNAAFSPSEEDIAHAVRVLAVFDAARATGAAATRLDGKLVDRPIVERAQRVLAYSQRGT